jgi:hypothetical protein
MAETQIPPKKASTAFVRVMQILLGVGLLFLAIYFLDEALAVYAYEVNGFGTEEDIRLRFEAVWARHYRDFFFAVASAVLGLVTIIAGAFGWRWRSPVGK